MNELTKTNQDLEKKEALGQYVHDMVDLEIRAFSLRKTAEETRKEAERKERAANGQLKEVQREIKNREDDLQRAQREKVSSTPIKHGVIAFFISFLPASVMMSIYYMDEDMTGWAIGFGAIFSFVIFLMVMVLRIGEERKAIANNIIVQEKLLDKSKTSYSNKVKMYEGEICCVQSLFEYADQLDKDIAEIETTLQKNYALKIIPPDYRRLECLVWIDYAFRNDQVDTMREATLQCDKWVRHTDTMKALKELAENIRSIAVLLENMDSNISMMNQDLFRIAEAQEKQLSESQSARYAMESVQKSTERLAMYEDMKRAGTF